MNTHDYWLLRKPLSKPTIAENVLAHGTGAINVDACRVGTGDDRTSGGLAKERFGINGMPQTERPTGGRFPANLIHDGSEEVVRLFPESGNGKIGMRGKTGHGNSIYGNFNHQENRTPGITDSGSAARFFYEVNGEDMDTQENTANNDTNNDTNNNTNNNTLEAQFHARVRLFQGNCLDLLKQLESDSVDSIVTDPPAGISFMNKSWDTDFGHRDQWIAYFAEIAKECLRVVKPGGHALVWALPRTSHWTATAWENGGWEIRDRIIYCFGSGFPKSHNISKAIDKLAGSEREVVGVSPAKDSMGSIQRASVEHGARKYEKGLSESLNVEMYGGIPITAPATDAAKQWDGWGTALKPAVEDWWLARKPLIGTVAENVMQHGTGAINVDACRVEGAPRMTHKDGNMRATSIYQQGKLYDETAKHDRRDNPSGRFPANLIHDGSDEVVEMFPQAGGSKPIQSAEGFQRFNGTDYAGGKTYNAPAYESPGYGDTGSAARFFYCAKASKADRDEGCEGLEEREAKRTQAGGDDTRVRPTPCNRNHHPTVKPTDLMRYLVRLVTPPDGIVLDPFMGSGSTGKACMLEGFRFIGMEMEEEYVVIARARILHALKPEVQEQYKKKDLKRNAKKVK